MLISNICVRTKSHSISHHQTMNNPMQNRFSHLRQLQLHWTEEVSSSEIGRMCFCWILNALPFSLGSPSGNSQKTGATSFLSIDLSCGKIKRLPYKSKPLAHPLFICYVYWKPTLWKALFCAMGTRRATSLSSRTYILAGVADIKEIAAYQACDKSCGNNIGIRDGHWWREGWLGLIK